MLDLNHLHLHVRDLERSQRFYEAHFGFHERVRHGDILFLRNDDGFDLALIPDPQPAALPGWFHFGFRLPTEAAVREFQARLVAAGERLPRPLVDEEDMVSLRVCDPDGYTIEVYWE